MFKRTLIAVAGAALLFASGPSLADDWTNLYGALQTSMYGGSDLELSRLLDSGVDIDTQNSDGWTLLHIAAEQGKVGQVQMLLNRGADPTIKTLRGKTAFDVTDSAQIKRLLSAAVAKAGGQAETLSPQEAWTQARWAIEYNQRDELARLLDAGLDVNTRSKDGWTLLMWPPTRAT